MTSLVASRIIAPTPAEHITVVTRRISSIDLLHNRVAVAVAVAAATATADRILKTFEMHQGLLQKITKLDNLFLVR